MFYFTIINFIFSASTLSLFKPLKENELYLQYDELKEIFNENNKQINSLTTDNANFELEIKNLFYNLKSINDKIDAKTKSKGNNLNLLMVPKLKKQLSSLNSSKSSVKKRVNDKYHY